MFKLGDRVVNSAKSFAPVQRGRIVGFIEGAAYFEAVKHESDIWEIVFPGWKNKLVYYVWLDEPSTRVREEYQFLTKHSDKYSVMGFTEDDLRLENGV